MVDLNDNHEPRQPMLNGRATWTALILAGISTITSGSTYVAGSRPNAQHDKLIDKLEDHVAILLREQAEIAARAKQNTERIDRLDRELDRLRSGGK